LPSLFSDIPAATREVVQAHIGHAMSKPNADEILANDFAEMAETMALLSLRAF
jgi:3-hydroxyisobutyrate dehydrogenase